MDELRALCSRKESVMAGHLEKLMANLRADWMERLRAFC